MSSKYHCLPKTTLTHIWTNRDWESMNNIWISTIQREKISAWRRGSDHKFPSLTKNILLPARKRISISLQWLLLGICVTFQRGPISSSRWPMQNSSFHLCGFRLLLLSYCFILLGHIYDFFMVFVFSMRKRIWSWLGKVAGTWDVGICRRENMIKIYCKNTLINLKK